jgi:Ca2+-binding RTX toxin-like protein
VFNTALNGSSNVDTINDFDANPSGGQDIIYLDRAIFTALTSGTLSAAEFVANTSGNAANAAQHIIFETDTGKLYYDADGNGSGAKVQFATLSGFTGGAAAAIDHTDFFII